MALVYQQELPNVPGKSIKGVLVEYGSGGYSPGHTHAKSAFIYATVLEGVIRSEVTGKLSGLNAPEIAAAAQVRGRRHAR